MLGGPDQSAVKARANRACSLQESTHGLRPSPSNGNVRGPLQPRSTPRTLCDPPYSILEYTPLPSSSHTHPHPLELYSWHEGVYYSPVHTRTLARQVQTKVSFTNHLCSQRFSTFNHHVHVEILKSLQRNMHRKFFRVK